MSNNGEYVPIEADYAYNDTSNSNRFVAFKNPFRYRSYYYDFETKLYYLNSRYYDPEIGRFINSDDVSVLDATKVTINGLNLYAYCLNNPVNEVDENGYLLLWLFISAILVGSIISAGTSIVSQGLSKGWNNINWLQVGWDTMIGAISGAFSMSGLDILGMVLISTGIALVSSVGSHLINGSDFTDWRTWLDIGLSISLGAFFGYIGGAGARNATTLDKTVRHSSQFTKVALSYDKVLTNITTGVYKNLAGAAGARAITAKALQITWQKIINTSLLKSVLMGFIFNLISGTTSIFQSWILSKLT